MTGTRYAPGPYDADYRPPPLAPHLTDDDDHESTAYNNVSLGTPLPQGTSSEPYSYPESSPSPYGGAPPPLPTNYPQRPPPIPSSYPQPPPPNQYIAPTPPPLPGSVTSPAPHPHNNSAFPTTYAAGDDEEANGATSESDTRARPWGSFGIGVICGTLFNFFGFIALCLHSPNTKRARRRRRFLCAGIAVGMLIQVLLIVVLAVAVPVLAVGSALKKRRPSSKTKTNSYLEAHYRHKRARSNVRSLQLQLPQMFIARDDIVL